MDNVLKHFSRCARCFFEKSGDDPKQNDDPQRGNIITGNLNEIITGNSDCSIKGTRTPKSLP